MILKFFKHNKFQYISLLVYSTGLVFINLLDKYRGSNEFISYDIFTMDRMEFISWVILFVVFIFLILSLIKDVWFHKFVSVFIVLHLYTTFILFGETFFHGSFNNFFGYLPLVYVIFYPIYIYLKRFFYNSSYSKEKIKKNTLIITKIVKILTLCNLLIFFGARYINFLYNNRLYNNFDLARNGCEYPPQYFNGYVELFYANVFFVLVNIVFSSVLFKKNKKWVFISLIVFIALFWFFLGEAYGQLGCS